MLDIKSILCNVTDRGYSQLGMVGGKHTGRGCESKDIVHRDMVNFLCPGSNSRAEQD